MCGKQCFNVSRTIFFVRITFFVKQFVQTFKNVRSALFLTNAFVQILSTQYHPLYSACVTTTPVSCTIVPRSQQHLHNSSGVGLIAACLKTRCSAAKLLQRQRCRRSCSKLRPAAGRGRCNANSFHSRERVQPFKLRTCRAAMLACDSRLKHN